VEQAIDMGQASRAAAAQFERFVRATTAKGRSPIPPTYATVASFLLAFAINNKSARSLPNVLSQLKTESERRKLGWLHPVAATRLRKLVRHLRLHCRAASRQKDAFIFDYLMDAMERFDLENPVELLEATILAVGHDGLLRSGEIASDVRADQITWWRHRTGFTLRLLRDKTHRDSGVLINFADNTSRFSAVKLFRAWWDLRGLQGNDRVFPAIRRGRIVASHAASTAQLRRLIKRAAASIGLDPSRFSGHSLRAGGATDLFKSNVPYPIIKKMGRWVSDAAMLYYRSDEDVWQTVGAAFSALAAQHK
jgi:hypothetical protein